MITPEDLRSAVRSGLLTEAQASGLTALAATRLHSKSGMAPAEEPFVLFRGFNEIFIVIGLVILFTAWGGVMGLMAFRLGLPELLAGGLLTLLTVSLLAAVQHYFTTIRRMVAPSIALSVMTALSLGTLGGVLGEAAGLAGGQLKAAAFAMATLGMALHYRHFRVPFDAAIIGLCGFSTVWSLLAHRGMVPDEALAILHFSSEGLPALLSLAFGFGCFALAMRFDMSDPHRLSTRAATGFWLHMLAAPAIINPLAVRLMWNGQGGDLLLLLVLSFLALVALVVDRRSFLVSGAVYATGVIFTLFNEPMLVVLGLGCVLVLLGAQWDRLRGVILRALPEFPGKDRLPPYGITS